MLPAGNAPPGASEPASELLFQYLLQHLLIQTQIGHQFLQPLIFILQLPQTPQFRHAQTSKFLLPVVKGGLINAHLSADFPDAGAGFGLFQRKHNLFFGITGLFQVISLSVSRKKDRRLQFRLVLFSGGDQSKDAIERQERNGVRAAYVHKAENLEAIIEMMRWWSDYLDVCREGYIAPYIYARQHQFT